MAKRTNRRALTQALVDRDRVRRDRAAGQVDVANAMQHGALIQALIGADTARYATDVGAAGQSEALGLRGELGRGALAVRGELGRGRLDLERTGQAQRGELGGRRLSIMEQANVAEQDYRGRELTQRGTLAGQALTHAQTMAGAQRTHELGIKQKDYDLALARAEMDLASQPSFATEAAKQVITSMMQDNPGPEMQAKLLDALAKLDQADLAKKREAIRAMRTSLQGEVVAGAPGAPGTPSPAPGPAPAPTSPIGEAMALRTGQQAERTEQLGPLVQAYVGAGMDETQSIQADDIYEEIFGEGAPGQQWIEAAARSGALTDAEITQQVKDAVTERLPWTAGRGMTLGQRALSVVGPWAMPRAIEQAIRGPGLVADELAERVVTEVRKRRVAGKLGPGRRAQEARPE